MMEKKDLKKFVLSVKKFHNLSTLDVDCIFLYYITRLNACNFRKFQTFILSPTKLDSAEVLFLNRPEFRLPRFDFRQNLHEITKRTGLKKKQPVYFVRKK